VQLFKDITTFYTNLANGKGKVLKHWLLGEVRKCSPSKFEPSSMRPFV